MNKIAIMGGTFDPIHNGHLIAAQAVYDTGLFESVWIMPSGNPPHKSEQLTDRAHRMRMCELAVNDHEGFLASDYELKRDGFIYSVDTFANLQEDYPDKKFYLVIGTDNMRNINKWYQHERLFSIGAFLIVDRGGYQEIDVDELVNTYYNQYGTDFIRVAMPQIEISSTDIRERVKDGKSISYRVPETVIRYIRLNNLYI